MAHVTSFSSADSEYKTVQYLSDESNYSNLPVRIVLFKECRFKERQLLFDSYLQHDAKSSEIRKNEPNKATNGPLHLYSKNNEEFRHLTEMIFGSTAMRYHGTYFKVHSVSSPHRIIFTQVFSTPYKRKISKPATTLNSNKSLKSSYNLSEWDFKNDVSDIAMNAMLSYNSESSISIFRKNLSSDTNSSTSTMDSGFKDQSFNSNSSSLYSQFSNFSKDNLTLVSIDEHNNTSNISLNFKDSFLSKTSSSTECCIKSNIGYSRLGLAIIIAVSAEKNIFQHFYMNHISFIEPILWRVRQYLDYALNTPKYFISLMIEISNDSTQWLADIAKDLNFVENFWNKDADTRTCDSDQSLNSSTHCPEASTSIFSNVRKLVKDKWGSLHGKNKSYSHKCDKKQYFRKWCELMMEVDVKDRNFFLSSLLTVILTYHTGWISSSYEFSTKEDLISRNSYNSLWRQLMDLCGIVGQIPKSSKIVIYNSENEKVIKDIIKFLRYFIRYFRVQKREIERYNIMEENKVVNSIIEKQCNENSMYVMKKSVKEEKKGSFSKPTSVLNKTKTFCSNLADLACIEENSDVMPEEDAVIFILGDDEKLVNLRTSENHLDINSTVNEDIYDVGIRTEYIFQDINEMSKNKPCCSKFEKNNTHENTSSSRNSKTKIISFPLPKFRVSKDFTDTVPYEFSLKNDCMTRFVPDLVIQGTVAPEKQWRNKLKNDLSSCSNLYLAGGNIGEAVAILGDTDKWKVQILSSNKTSVHKTSPNETIDTSQLVADMLEVTQQMWKLAIPKQYCTTHMEQRLLEISLRSHTLAHLLMTTDFCTMDLLLSILDVKITDIPLLMSVASTICPEVTQKYGLSYQ